MKKKLLLMVFAAIAVAGENYEMIVGTKPTGGTDGPMGGIRYSICRLNRPDSASGRLLVNFQHYFGNVSFTDQREAFDDAFSEAKVATICGQYSALHLTQQ